MKIKQQSIELCYAIEAAGASEALTKCSVLASELNTEAKRLAELADKMKRFAAENYPPNEAGQVDFVRVVLEGYAQEMTEPEPNGPSEPRGKAAPKAEVSPSRVGL